MIISINDLNYCFNQLQQINPIDSNGKLLNEIQVLLPTNMPINQQLQKEGIELQRLFTFKRVVRDDNQIIWKAEKRLEIVTQY